MKYTLILAFAAAVAVNAQDACHSKHTDEKSCLADTTTGGGCAWCKCAALPSSCWTISDATKLPAGVYECTNSSKIDFDTWAKKYSKAYKSPAEKQLRKSYFEKNLQDYAERNAAEGKHGLKTGATLG